MPTFPVRADRKAALCARQRHAGPPNAIDLQMPPRSLSLIELK